jgi:hypothetical protein
VLPAKRAFVVRMMAWTIRLWVACVASLACIGEYAPGMVEGAALGDAAGCDVAVATVPAIRTATLASVAAEIR